MREEVVQDLNEQDIADIDSFEAKIESNQISDEVKNSELNDVTMSVASDH